FGAHHPVRRELIVEAALYAAKETGVAALQGIVAREGAANMAADIEAGPVIHDLGRGIGRRLGVRPRLHVGRKSWSRHGGQRGSAEHELLHFTIPVTNVADTNPNNVTSFRLLCGRCPRPDGAPL